MRIIFFLMVAVSTLAATFPTPMQTYLNSGSITVNGVPLTNGTQLIVSATGGISTNDVNGLIFSFASTGTVFYATYATNSGYASNAGSASTAAIADTANGLQGGFSYSGQDLTSGRQSISLWYGTVYAYGGFSSLGFSVDGNGNVTGHSGIFSDIARGVPAQLSLNGSNAVLEGQSYLVLTNYPFANTNQIPRYFDFQKITNATPVNGLVVSGSSSNLYATTTIPFGVTFNGNLTVNGTTYQNIIINTYTNIYMGITTNYVNQSIYITNYSAQITIITLGTNIQTVIGGQVYNNSYINGTNMSYMSTPHFTDTKGSNIVCIGMWDWTGASWLNPPTNGWVFGTAGALTSTWTNSVDAGMNSLTNIHSLSFMNGASLVCAGSTFTITSCSNGVGTLNLVGTPIQLNGQPIGQLFAPYGVTNVNLSPYVATNDNRTFTLANATVGTAGTLTGGIPSDASKANSNNTFTVIVNGTTNVSYIGQSSTLNLGNMATVTGSVNYATSAGTATYATSAGVATNATQLGGQPAANFVTNNGIIFNGTPLANGSNTVSVGSTATNQVSLKYDGQLPNTTNDLNGVSLDLNPTQATANQYIRNGISLYNASTSSMTNYVMFSFTYAKANATNINLGFYRSGYTGMVSNNFVSFNWTNRVQGGASMYSGIYTVSVNAASTWTNMTLVVPSFTNVPAGSTIQGWWYATPYSTNGASSVEYFTLESGAQIW